MMSVLVSYVLTVLMEMPFLNLDKIWLGKLKSQNRNGASTTDNPAPTTV